jgi:hypothetical protein
LATWYLEMIFTFHLFGNPKYLDIFNLRNMSGITPYQLTMEIKTKVII